ncbi:MAG TPA: phasin family protein [Burkholderiales bacterium]|jgi:phasin family protein|nr:phasin family protein [Burkholderiales bacterium]
MSNPEIEQMSVAQKASAEVLMTLMRTSFEGMQRLAELNMAAARETFSSNVATVTKLAASKDVGDMARANQELARPERMLEYWRSVYDLVSAMQKDVSAVMQANYTQLTRTAASAIEQKKSSAVDGSDVIAGVMKNMLEQTNKAFDNMTAVANQMTSMANANIQAATTATAKTVGSVTEIVSKK